MVFNYILKLLLFVIIAIIIDSIHVYVQIYMRIGILYRINFNNTVIVYKIVQFANALEKVVDHIPYLFLDKEGGFYLYCIGIYEPINWNVLPNIKERILVCVEKIFGVMKHVFRINLIYVIYVLWFFWRPIIDKMVYAFDIIRPNIYQFLDYLKTCLTFIQNNGWLIFILFVSIIIFLKDNLERKLSGLPIDEELENEKADFKQIAICLDSIRGKLYECANNSKINEDILHRLLNQLEYSFARKSFDDKEYLKNTMDNCLNGLNDDLETLKVIKGVIKNIEDLGGKNIYANYHLDIWKNVSDLHITSSSTQFLFSRKQSVIQEINRRIDSDEEKDTKLLYAKLIKSVRVHWIEELDYSYQLSKYFKFIKRRKRKYKNLKKEILLTDKALSIAEHTKDK
ncbi:hypothetical protein [Lacrimispora sp.]|uniref:hypothetical protein n=1 Tax=Lacrimispora sp. TaxID=2719234 RepID=UPI002FDA7D92